MLLTLYKTLDGDNVINKVLTNAENFTINLKSDTDIRSPEIVLKTVSSVDYKDYNYCHIPELNRFYFIREMVILNNTVFKLICETDCLETFKSDIISSNCYYMKEISAGEYGEVKVNKTGNQLVNNYISSIEMVESDNVILSLLKGKVYGN